jgi:hypothetical protein
LEVKVKDVSVGGVGFLAPRRFEKGTLMFLTLGGADASRVMSVLVRVVRLVAQGNGFWLIGCAFVGKASEEEIQACREGAQPAERPALDRRGWLRLPCYVLTVCRPGGGASNGRWPVEVRDHSSRGLGLIVPDELEQASELRVALPALDGSPQEIQVRVCRRTRLGNGKWLLGCEFCQDSSGQGTAARPTGKNSPATPTPAQGSSRPVTPRPPPEQVSNKLMRVLSRLTTQVLAQQRSWEQELAGDPERLAGLEARVRHVFREVAEQVVAELRIQAAGPALQPSASS